MHLWQMASGAIEPTSIGVGLGRSSRSLGLAQLSVVPRSIGGVA